MFIMRLGVIFCMLLLLCFVLSIPGALKYGNMCPDSKLLELEKRIEALERRRR